MLMKLTTVVNFINLFMSVKIQPSCQYLFVLLGCARVNAAHKMLMKSNPGVNFINVLQAAFTYEAPKSAKRQSSCKSFLHFYDLCEQKQLIEH